MYKKLYMKNQETNYSISDEGKVRNDKNGKYIQTFKSYTHAAEVMKVTYAAIKRAVDSKGSSCGYFWVKSGENFISKRKPSLKK